MHESSYRKVIGTRKILQCAIHRFTYIYFNKNFLMESVDTSIWEIKYMYTVHVLVYWSWR